MDVCFAPTGPHACASPIRVRAMFAMRWEACRSGILLACLAKLMSSATSSSTMHTSPRASAASSAARCISARNRFFSSMRRRLASYQNAGLLDHFPPATMVRAHRAACSEPHGILTTKRRLLIRVKTRLRDRRLARGPELLHYPGCQMGSWDQAAHSSRVRVPQSRCGFAHLHATNRPGSPSRASLAEYRSCMPARGHRFVSRATDENRARG